MTVTPAIRNMIRENKIHQIDGMIYSSSQDTMFSNDSSLLELCRSGLILSEDALAHASNPDMLRRKAVKRINPGQTDTSVTPGIFLHPADFTSYIFL